MMQIPETLWQAWETGLDVHGSFLVAHEIIGRERPAHTQPHALGELRKLASLFGGYNPLMPAQDVTMVMQQIGRDLARVCMDDDPNIEMENDTNSTEGVTRLNEPESTDEVGLMEDRWKAGDKRRMSPTRLWRELPSSRKTESHRKLGPPWKKQGNPPLKDRKTDTEPRAPRTPPPRTTAKPKARPGVCRTPTPVETRRQDEEEEAELETVDLEEDNDQDMTTEDALAVWQALLEMQQGEEFNIASPILPTHVADNIVETLVDRPEAQRNLLSDTLPLFLSRVHRDLARALERARNLRAMLGRASSSTDPPHEAGPPEAEQETEEGCLMQTNIGTSTAAAASREDLLLQRLHRALQSLDPGVASARAIRLASQLQDHDGPLAVDRSLLESLLIAASEETQPLARGDHLLLEHAWCATWWRRLRGIQEVTDEDADEAYDEMDRLLAQREEQDRAAEQAEHEAREAQYLRGLEDAVEHHYEAMKSAATQAEDDQTLQRAMGYTRSRAKPRFCLGVCVTNGKMEKAWDFEINPEAPVQVHIKAEMLEGRSQWYRAGEPVSASEVPQEVRDMATASSSTMPPPSHRHFDVTKPATRHLYERWRARDISPQAVVGIGGTGLLAYFHALSDIPDDVWADLGQRDTLTLEPAGPHVPDGPGTGTAGPTTTT